MDKGWITSPPDAVGGFVGFEPCGDAAQRVGLGVEHFCGYVRQRVAFDRGLERQRVGKAVEAHDGIVDGVDGVDAVVNGGPGAPSFPMR